ncbi:MAG: M23 family metallopeptidase, partial [Methylococcales bacterium]|nr:M23 family metallopeptidase [Methylococcales bacterium]
MSNKISVNKSWLAFIVVLFLGTACTELLTPSTREPLFILATAVPVNLETPSIVITDNAGNIQIVDKPTATPTFTPTPFVTRENAGIRPAQAQQSAIVNQATPVPIEWRPPPYAVPLSIHPNDHCWLMRPLPSGSRNYDLDWYPYGSDVFIPALAPYRIHHGLDFPNDAGTPIVAVANGTVVWAGARPSPRNGVNYYGNTIIIKHDWQWLGQDVYTLYAHTLEMFVTTGDRVQAGELIAGVGASGEVSGSHLHLEVRIGTNSYADVRNPLLWLAPYEGWGTLAGRFVDKTGRLIQGAEISLYAVEGNAGIRRTRTYFGSAINSDEVWQENFVLADVVPGR